ncbi:hypothetical protein HanLR1_Chr00c2495g0846211 [Helianthus annuus]|nr:hypothetical protein HanLR1_Chr00c2495g0846211 [Helianthus annuus]
MKEYAGMVATQVAQVLLMIVSKEAIADGMTSYSFIFYSNAIASLILLPFSHLFHRSSNSPPLSFNIVVGFLIVGLLGYVIINFFSFLVCFRIVFFFLRKIT